MFLRVLDRDPLVPVSRLTAATLRFVGGINLRTIYSLISAQYLVMDGSYRRHLGRCGADNYRGREDNVWLNHDNPAREPLPAAV